MLLPSGIGRGRRSCSVFLSFLLVATAGAASAAAQTVYVRSAPQGSTVELTMNGGAPTAATADNNGDAKLMVPSRTAEAAVVIHLDTCANRVRVLLVETGIQPQAPDAGCNRVDVASVFVMRPVTTFVIDMDSATPAVHITQGPPPADWVERGAAAKHGINWGVPAKGLVLSAGAGRSAFSNAVDSACGDAQPCDRTNFAGGLAFGVDYWITPYVGAAASYMSPADVVIAGSGDTFSFNTRLTVRLATIAGKAGVPLGPARLYGFGGLNRHESTLTTSQTINDKTVVVDSVPQTIKGGTQSFAQKTSGWNWIAGGGVELWVRRWIALYGELTLATIKGAPITGGEGGIDDRATFILGGVRVRLGF